MNRITKYVLRNFTESFNPIFFSLFFMVSIIYFIKIAKITSIIKITFLELGELYLYVLPRIILYTFPVVFFIAITISFAKMSRDNEIIVIFSFGFSPKKVAKIFSYLSLTISILLLLNAIFLIPVSKQLYNNFIRIKKNEAKLNISAMEFGQKFSNWFVFINRSDGKNGFDDIVMYKKDKSKEDFIIAQKASVKSKKGYLKLTLNQGRVYEMQKKQIRQTDFKTLKITNKTKTASNYILTVLEYWKESLKNKNRAKDLATFILVSLFPILSFFVAISFGIFNPRYEKDSIYPSIFISVLTYYIFMYLTISINPFLSIILTPVIFLSLSYYIFKIKILKRY